jgi:hypothetical protein
MLHHCREAKDQILLPLNAAYTFPSFLREPAKERGLMNIEMEIYNRLETMCIVTSIWMQICERLGSTIKAELPLTG